MTYQGLKSDLDVLQSSYQPYQDDPGGSDSEDDSPPQFHGGGRGATGDQPHMIHIVPEQGKSKWSHIDDLDSFFSKVYEYHQKHGFTVMMLQEVLELLQFIFIVCFTVFLAECVNYPLLFREEPFKPKDDHKMTLYDVTRYVDFREMSFLTQVIQVVTSNPQSHRDVCSDVRPHKRLVLVHQAAGGDASRLPVLGHQMFLQLSSQDQRLEPGVRYVVGGAGEADRRPDRAHDVHPQTGANTPRRVSQNTQVGATSQD